MLKLNMCLQLQARGCISKFTFLLDPRKPQKLIVKKLFYKKKIKGKGFLSSWPRLYIFARSTTITTWIRH